jgi:TolB-like protein/Tfp pilus assembly protein PilF
MTCADKCDTLPVLRGDHTMSDSLVEPGSGERLTLFLSYGRADRAIAEKLGAALRTSGFEVWWDALIEGGAIFTKSIETALDAADAIIVLWSKVSVESDWVRDEAGRGRDRKRLVPISIDSSEPPLGFRQYHTIDMSKWHGRNDSGDYANLLRSIAAIVDQPMPSAVRAPMAMPRRTLVLGGLGVGALAAGGAGVWSWKAGLLGGNGASQRSIAVLPFKNLSSDKDQLYFSDGLTDDLRAALTRNNALQVLAATSSETARDHKDDAQAVARNLGVAYLLEGSVRRAGDVVRVSAELTDGKTGFSKWSNTLDRKMTDIFAVQSEIARTVTEALSVALGTDAATPGGTTNVAAYEAFLKGRALFYGGGDEASDRAALALFDTAISLDPKFADAFASRARSLSVIAAEHAKGSELRSLQAEALVSARRAVALAPDMASGHLALGNAIFNGEMNVAGARSSYDKAFALGRGDANLVLLYALYCARAGRTDDARNAVNRAIALDPLNARTYRAAGSIAYAARQYQQAIPQLKRALSIKPKLSNTYFYIGNCLYMLGKFADARAAFAAEPQAMFRLYGAAIVEQRLGNVAAAKKAMAQLIADVGDSALYQQAEVLAQWGETDAALTTLERARGIGDSGLTYLKIDPMVDPLRKNPRFVALYKQLNFG